MYVDENWGGKGHETAVAWLPGNRLRIETGYRGINTLDVTGDWDQRFCYTFAIVSSAGKPESKANFKDSRLAPLSVYRQPQ